MTMLKCATHGEGPHALVCHHTVQTIQDLKPRGFHFVRSPEGTINAWCDACKAKLRANGNTWTGEAQEFADIKAVCESCAAVAAGINQMESQS